MVSHVSEHSVVTTEFLVLVEHELDDCADLLIRVKDELPVLIFHKTSGGMDEILTAFRFVELSAF